MTNPDRSGASEHATLASRCICKLTHRVVSNTANERLFNRDHFRGPRPLFFPTRKDPNRRRRALHFVDMALGEVTAQERSTTVKIMFQGKEDARGSNFVTRGMFAFGKRGMVEKNATFRPRGENGGFGFGSAEWKAGWFFFPGDRFTVIEHRRCNQDGLRSSLRSTGRE